MPRDTLTREQIVSAAIDLLDAEGLEGLNMRALGQRLGSAATAVYWHVGSKDNLIALAADQVWSEIARPDPDAAGWQAAAAAMATDLYATLTRHPSDMALVSRRRPTYALMKLYPGWELMWQDEDSALFLPKGSPRRAAIDAATKLPLPKPNKCFPQ